MNIYFNLLNNPDLNIVKSFLHLLNHNSQFANELDVLATDLTGKTLLYRLAELPASETKSEIFNFLFQKLTPIDLDHTCIIDQKKRHILLALIHDTLLFKKIFTTLSDIRQQELIQEFKLFLLAIQTANEELAELLFNKSPNAITDSINNTNQTFPIICYFRRKDALLKGLQNGLNPYQLFISEKSQQEISFLTIPENKLPHFSVSNTLRTLHDYFLTFENRGKTKKNEFIKFAIHQLNYLKQNGQDNSATINKLYHFFEDLPAAQLKEYASVQSESGHTLLNILSSFNNLAINPALLKKLIRYSYIDPKTNSLLTTKPENPFTIRNLPIISVLNRQWGYQDKDFYYKKRDALFSAALELTPLDKYSFNELISIRHFTQYHKRQLELDKLIENELQKISPLNFLTNLINTSLNTPTFNYSPYAEINPLEFLFSYLNREIPKERRSNYINPIIEQADIKTICLIIGSNTLSSHEKYQVSIEDPELRSYKIIPRIPESFLAPIITRVQNATLEEKLYINQFFTQKDLNRLPSSLASQIHHIILEQCIDQNATNSKKGLSL